MGVLSGGAGPWLVAPAPAHPRRVARGTVARRVIEVAPAAPDGAGPGLGRRVGRVLSLVAAMLAVSQLALVVAAGVLEPYSTALAVLCAASGVALGAPRGGGR